MKRYLFPTIMLAMALILAACGGSTKAEATALPPVPVDYAGQTNPLGVDAVAAGADSFSTYCAPCHGATGLGDGPAGQSLDPRPASLPALAAQVGDDYLFWRVSTGKTGTSMVAWAGVLTEEQIWQVVTFIRTLK